MNIIELKNGSVDVNDIDTYNKLKSKLDFIKQRLNCVTSPRFKKEFFRLGDCECNTFENKDYIMLANNRSNMDNKLRQDVIDFLTIKFTEQANEVINQINELIL